MNYSNLLTFTNLIWRFLPKCYQFTFLIQLKLANMIMTIDGLSHITNGYLKNPTLILMWRCVHQSRVWNTSTNMHTKVIMLNLLESRTLDMDEISTYLDGQQVSVQEAIWHLSKLNVTNLTLSFVYQYTCHISSRLFSWEDKKQKLLQEQL